MHIGQRRVDPNAPYLPQSAEGRGAILRIVHELPSAKSDEPRQAVNDLKGEPRHGVEWPLKVDGCSDRVRRPTDAKRVGQLSGMAYRAGKLLGG